MPSIEQLAQQKSANKRLSNKMKPANLERFIRFKFDSVAPTVADDASVGHNRLDQWLDTTAEDVYILVNAVAGTWKKITP